MVVSDSKIIADLLKRLEGLTVALATPLDDRGELDRPALQRLINGVIDQGAAGVFPLGWCGEQPCLTDNVRETVMHETVQITAGRVPVIIGVSEQSLVRALNQAVIARKAGADIVLSTPPFSYPVPQHSVYDFFRILAEESGLPVIAYHNEEVSVLIEVETTIRLSETPGMLGLKAFGNLVFLQRLLRQTHCPGRFAVFTANEYLFGPALFLGARYSTMGGPGNLIPRWCVEMHRAAAQGKWAKVAEQHQRLISFCEAIYVGFESAYSVVKYTMSRLGIGTPYVSAPLPSLRAQDRKRLDKALEEFSDMLATY